MDFRQLQALNKFAIPVYITEPRRLEDIPRTMKNLGCLTGMEKTADQAAEKYSQRLTALREKYSAQKPLTLSQVIFCLLAGLVLASCEFGTLRSLISEL